MYKRNKYFQRAGIALAMSFLAGTAFAGSIANEQIDSGGLTLSPTVSYDSASLRVSSDSSESTSSFTAGEGIRVDAGSLSDGVYHYELSLSSVAAVDDGSGASSAVAQNGKFRVLAGVAGEYNDDIANAEADQEAVAAELVSAANATMTSKNND